MGAEHRQLEANQLVASALVSEQNEDHSASFAKLLEEVDEPAATPEVKDKKKVSRPLLIRELSRSTLDPLGKNIYDNAISESLTAAAKRILDDPNPREKGLTLAKVDLNSASAGAGRIVRIMSSKTSAQVAREFLYKQPRSAPAAGTENNATATKSQEGIRKPFVNRALGSLRSISSQ